MWRFGLGVGLCVIEDDFLGGAEALFRRRSHFARDGLVSVPHGEKAMAAMARLLGLVAGAAMQEKAINDD